MSAPLVAGMVAFLQTPVELNGLQRLSLLLPLCLSISIVYKTTRCDSLSEMPISALVLTATLLAGMIGVGVFMWMVYLLLA